MFNNKRIEELEQQNNKLELQYSLTLDRLDELEYKLIYEPMTKQELYDEFKYHKFKELNNPTLRAIVTKFNLFIVNSSVIAYYPINKKGVHSSEIVGKVIDDNNLLEEHAS